MATVYPAARNLCAAVTYTRSRNCWLPSRAAHDDIKKKKRKRRRKEEEEEAIYMHSGV